MPSSMPTSDTLQARFMDLFFPLYLLFISLSYLPSTIIHHPLLVFRPRSLQSIWFASLWNQIGPQMALSPEQIPYISSLMSRAKGTVLELGPGSGDQMRHFMQVVQDGKVDRVVGAEPNASLHPKLKLNAKSVGLDPDKGRYMVLQAGAQPASLIPALHKAGMYPSGGGSDGVFDTIICIKSMCSVPQRQMEETCNLIYGLLKPGGEFLFFEHVKNETDLLTMIYAWVLGWLWPLAMGGCQLNGRVDRVVKQMGTGKGRWDSVDVRNAREFRGWNVFRYAVGICRK